MKSYLHQLVRKLPGFFALNSLRKRLLGYYYSTPGKTKALYASYYKSGYWEGKESASGPGSSLDQTRRLIDELPNFLARLNVESVLDIPCGDYNWMKECNLAGIRYHGADIVPAIIDSNRQYANHLRTFSCLDVIHDSLPTVDLILSRDCFVHLSYQQISSALRNVCNSGATFLLTTHFLSRSRENVDIIPGQWRPINWELPPFSFPAPEEIIVENCTEGDGQYADKSLALWRIDQLRKSIASSA